MRVMLRALRDTYCRNVGAEFMHISDPTAKRWIQERLESTLGVPSYPAERKRHILQQVTEAEGLERFLHTKYVGQKRFSLEGGRSEEHTSALTSLMRNSYAVFCLKKKKRIHNN